jgi:hypothetical protein
MQPDAQVEDELQKRHKPRRGERKLRLRFRNRCFDFPADAP